MAGARGGGGVSRDLITLVLVGLIVVPCAFIFAALAVALWKDVWEK